MARSPKDSASATLAMGQLRVAVEKMAAARRE